MAEYLAALNGRFAGGINEAGRSVVGDVIFPKDGAEETERSLSDILTDGYDGSHWIGKKIGDVESSGPDYRLLGSNSKIGLKVSDCVDSEVLAMA